MPEQIAVALSKCASHEASKLTKLIGDLCDKADFKPAYGSKILVKPNLLTARDLACASPQVTTAVCKWLLDRNCRATVSDSPAFGTPQKISQVIGLEEKLKELGLRVTPFRKIRQIPIQIDGKNLKLGISSEALESDAIFSIARVKAHSQMRMSLCVKNCFGTVPGFRKALLHGFYGKDRNFFAKILASVWQSLPMVYAVADGIVAMDKTGPIKGEAFPLGILGACKSAPLLDYSILQILNIMPENIPLTDLMLKEKIFNPACAVFTLSKPEDLKVEGFQVPEQLKSASFSPIHLAKSWLKRFLKKMAF